MDETLLGTIALIGTIILAFGCYLYMLGGREGKWKRRFVGSLIISSAVWIETLLLGYFNLWFLLVYPILATCFCLGYGGDSLPVKLFRRSLVVLYTLSIGVLFCLTIGGSAWVILPIQVVIGACSIWLGVKNPTPAAPEEFFVCLLLTECLLMYPFAGRVF